MENRKWLQRKYPKIFKEVNEFLNDEQLRNFKERKHKLGRLTEDINQVEIYSKGQLCMFKRTNPVNVYRDTSHLVLVKCNHNLTVSGYHSFLVFSNQVDEIQPYQ